MRLRTFALAALLGAASLFVHASADACDPACRSPLVPRGGDIPSGVTAIPYAPGASFQTSELRSPRLVGADGKELPATVLDDAWSGGQLLVTTKPLAGAVALELDDPCMGPPALVEREFQVGDARALPAVAGTLDVRRLGVGMTPVAEHGTCGYADAVAVTFSLLVTPSDELRAYRALTAYEILVDDVVVKRTFYGDAILDGQTLTIAGLHSTCGPHSGGIDEGPEHGLHVVTVRAHVAGAASDPPPMRATVDFSCDEPIHEPLSAPGNVTESTGSAKASPATEPSTSAAAPAADSGCRTSPGQSSGLGAVALGLALGALVKRRRR